MRKYAISNMHAGCELKWDRMKILMWVKKTSKHQTNFSTNRKKLNSFALISINLKLNSSRYENRKRDAIFPSHTKRNKVSVRVYWFFTSGIEREKIYNGWATDWWNQYSIHLIYVQEYYITSLHHVCVCGNCLRECFLLCCKLLTWANHPLKREMATTTTTLLIAVGPFLWTDLLTHHAYHTFRRWIYFSSSSTRKGDECTRTHSIH